MLILYDTSHAKLCALTNYSDCYIEEVVSGTGSSDNITLPQLHFKYPLEDPNNGKIALECYIALATDDGRDDAEYIVKEHNLKTEENGGITWVEYVCDLNVEPLKGTPIDNFAPGSVTPDQAVNLALAGTGWKVGYCDVTRRRTAAKTYCMVFDAIEDVAKAYACEITFDSINHLVNIHQKQGADRGVYFAEQLNLKSLEVQANSRSYVTRLYPRGKDGLTISDVNDGVPYVSNYQYSTKVIGAYWIDNRYTNAADLLADSQERLDYLSKPTQAYAAEIIDLARVSDQWSLLDFRLGDWITLVSESTGVREQQRIVKIDRYPDEPEKSTCELANRLASLDDIILRVSDAADAVDAATDSTGAVQGSLVQVTNPDGTYSNLNAVTAKVGSLIATKANITDLTAANGRIDNLVSTKADITYLQANYLTADSVKATYATIDSLSAATGDISKLKTDKLDAATAAITYATVSSLTVANGSISNLQSDSAKIINLLSDNAGINSLEAGTVSANYAALMHGQLGDAQIGSLSVAKLLAGNISTDKFTVQSNSGNLSISKNTIHVFDANGKERVTVGLNGSDYNLTVRASDGQTTIFGASGVTHAGITDGAVDDSKVATGANINGSKIDQESLVSRINGATTLLNSSRIKYDPTGQTLTAEFQTLSSTVSNQGTTLSTQGTNISAIQGQITNKVWTSDITNAVQPLETRMSSAEQKITPSAITSTVASNITGNQIASIINQSATTFSIDASKINMNGFVTLTQLSTPGATTISGSNIDTNTLKVQKIYNSDYGFYGKIGSFTFTNREQQAMPYTGIEFYGGNGYSGGVYSQSDVEMGGRRYVDLMLSPGTDQYANVGAHVLYDSASAGGTPGNYGSAGLFASDGTNFADVWCSTEYGPKVTMEVKYDAGSMTGINYITLSGSSIDINGLFSAVAFDFGTNPAAENYNSDTGAYYNPHAVKIGNIVFLFGLFDMLRATSDGDSVAFLPSSLAPKQQQILTIWTQYGPKRLDIMPSGTLRCAGDYPAGMYASVNTCHYII